MKWRYMLHDKYATSPNHYIRAYELIQKDLLNLFDYIEPSNTNLKTYSFRIHELLLRICVEVEANCKAILTENGYSKPGNWTVADYSKIEKSHNLSSYLVKLPVWKGTANMVSPFSAWATPSQPLGWYQSYNKTKHDRLTEFEQANFKNLIDAICGLVVILAAQFWTHNFSAGPMLLSMGTIQNDGMESAIGDYFRIKFPDNWLSADLYDFDWEQLKNDPNPFDMFSY